MLDALDRRLLEAARGRAAHLTGDPGRPVAAAVMDTLGRCHTGVGVRHPSGEACPEIVALDAAAGADAGPVILMVAVDAGRGAVVPPCGRCRQVLVDHHPDCRVIIPAPSGGQAVPVRDLLPNAYIDPDAHPERVVRFGGGHFEAVAAGREVATTRFPGSVALGRAWLVFDDSGGLRRLPVEVTSLEPRTPATLTDADARLEACAQASELREALRFRHPGLPDDAPLTLAHFRLIS